MLAEVSRLDLRLRRRSTVGYTLGVGCYALLIVALYPSFKNDHSLNELTTANPKLAALCGASGSLTSPDGWMNANLYANFLPLFALLMTIGYGAAAIAGQDEEGTLGGLAALPMTRLHLLLEKVLALGVLSLPIAVISLGATLAGRGFGLSLDLWAVIQVTCTVAVMALDFGLLALAVGAWTGSRSASLGISTAVAAAAYVISSLAPTVEWVHAIRYLSPIYWTVGANQVGDGATALQILLLALTGAGLGLFARVGLARLDIH